MGAAHSGGELALQPGGRVYGGEGVSPLYGEDTILLFQDEGISGETEEDLLCSSHRKHVVI